MAHQKNNSHMAKDLLSRLRSDETEVSAMAAVISFPSFGLALALDFEATPLAMIYPLLLWLLW